MSWQTTAGTTIGISAGSPATFDAAGYGNLAFTTIGEVTSFGEFGRTYAGVTHNPVGSRGTQKKKGSYNEGALQLALAIDHDDAGQTLATTALDDDADYSFCITFQDGSKDYFTGQVMSFTKNPSSVDSALTGNINIEITTSSDGDGIIHEAPGT